ncbi:hypothetical protein DPMN_005576 [Dreissena polymorpha]|uniref:Uncharacterized protein n=1 Tax=Dreissena polymorpha TaxID=45954 RepID=A0A9D4MSZ9_DREPO|nr:hypothetical protein DPMN_005576 [Dreissena polymorpha]
MNNSRVQHRYAPSMVTGVNGHLGARAALPVAMATAIETARACSIRASPMVTIVWGRACRQAVVQRAIVQLMVTGVNGHLGARAALPVAMATALETARACSIRASPMITIVWDRACRQAVVQRAFVQLMATGVNGHPGARAALPVAMATALETARACSIRASPMITIVWDRACRQAVVQRAFVQWTAFGHLGRRGRHAMSRVATRPSPEPETARFHQTL